MISCDFRVLVASDAKNFDAGQGGCENYYSSNRQDCSSDFDLLQQLFAIEGNKNRQYFTNWICPVIIPLLFLFEYLLRAQFVPNASRALILRQMDSLFYK